MAIKTIKSIKKAQKIHIRSQRFVRDSVFKILFSEKSNVERLYTEISGEKPENRTILTLTLNEKSLSTNLRNDLGFIVRDGQESTLFLVEAQSTWCPNMALRMNEYLIATYRQYLAGNDQKQKITGQNIITLPPPVFYIISTCGKKNQNEMHFSDMFSHQSKSNFNFTVFILEDENSSTISGQYIGFCRIYKKLAAAQKNGVECFEKVFEECKKKGYLVSFLNEHKNELEGYMMEEIEDRMAFEKFMQRSNKKAVEEAKPGIIAEAKPGIIAEAKPGIIEEAKPGIIEEAKPGIFNDAKKELFECIMLYKKGVIEKSEAAKRLGYSLSQIDMMLN